MNIKIFNIDLKIFKLRKQIDCLKKQKDAIKKRMRKSIKQRNENIIKLHKKGYNLRAIGKKVDLSHERVNQIIYDRKLKEANNG